MKANNISNSQTLRLASQLGMNVTNHINSQGFKDTIRTTLRSMSKSKHVKPDCVTIDGTLYRLSFFLQMMCKYYKNNKSPFWSSLVSTKWPLPLLC